MDQIAIQHEVKAIIHEKVDDLMVECIQTFYVVWRKHPSVKLD